MHPHRYINIVSVTLPKPNNFTYGKNVWKMRRTLIILSAAPVTNHSLPGSTSTQRTQPW